MGLLTGSASSQPTVVIVEDDESLRMITTRIVERECGYRVVAEARDGAEGVELVKAHAPDVVILDLGMPVMDGYTALPLILEAVPTTAVVVYSGRAPEEAESRCIEGGAFAYVEKDPSSRRLIDALCRAMHRAVGDPCACRSCAPGTAHA